MTPWVYMFEYNSHKCDPYSFELLLIPHFATEMFMSMAIPFEPNTLVFWNWVGNIGSATAQMLIRDRFY